MTVFQRVVTMAKDMPAAERSPSMAAGRLWSGFSDCQKPIFNGGCWLLVAGCWVF